ncbi:hypothetical protein EJ07DRAFT_185431 [Lizonia empirigonia]|nr:hypothetical protein EJ07DRAFT_185431 [Lizonia empirigonia]
MPFINKLDPSSAAFVPDPSIQSEAINYMSLFGTDFSAGFQDLDMNMDMNIEPSAPGAHAHEHEHVVPENPTNQHNTSGASNTSGITLEKVQMDMYIAFNSFMQLQSAYQAKLRRVETELANNVQEAHNLRQDVDVLSNWAKAVLEHFGHGETCKEAKAVPKSQDPVV